MSATSSHDDYHNTSNSITNVNEHQQEEIPGDDEITPILKPHSTMVYVETIRERKLREGSGKGVMDKLADFIESLYWMYYIHLPFYLMTSFDSACLHVFFLTIFSLSFFGILKYCFL